ncbi:hypothetical protein AB0K09_03575 [Streptomyces sp. NPDC049577]|uniref:hypothetical protein n=1 Tax=Streptomyces sp. NPDC049577 TaxID=3155153 RepID=UPI00343F3ADC
MSARLLSAIRFLGSFAIGALAVATPLAAGGIAGLYAHGDLNQLLPHQLRPDGSSLGLALVAAMFICIAVERLTGAWFAKIQARVGGKRWPTCPVCAQHIETPVDGVLPVPALPRRQEEQ